MLAYDDTGVISMLPTLTDLFENLPEGTLAEVVKDLLDRDSTDEPATPFQNYA